MSLLHNENPVGPADMTGRDADASALICASGAYIVMLDFFINLFGSGASQPILTANEKDFSF